MRHAATTEAVPGSRIPIYLRDHFAGSAAAVARCRSARDGNAGTELGAYLDRLLREIEEDREQLLRVLARLGEQPSRLKVAAAVAAERVGRLKPNGQLRGYSPLGRLLDLEMLVLGVHGKAALWRALELLDDPLLAEFDFGALAARAERQHDELEEHRRAVARVALAR